MCEQGSALTYWPARHPSRQILHVTLASAVLIDFVELREDLPVSSSLTSSYGKDGIEFIILRIMSCVGLGYPSSSRSSSSSS